ncbi:MAG: hypothetical protein A3A51_00825 [Candidatus Levybacteria bacterium RIFCSPLOWO2_01_FULL_39_10]|nr:MAG: hypothetical protein A3A51_00825 [Candidatus Levybacteria bacterium RIFCSPLOWO2_01_FULL_39_10]
MDCDAIPYTRPSRARGCKPPARGKSCAGKEPRTKCETAPPNHLLSGISSPLLGSLFQTINVLLSSQISKKFEKVKSDSKAEIRSGARMKAQNRDFTWT